MRIDMMVEVLPGGEIHGQGRWGAWSGELTARGASPADVDFRGVGRMPSSCVRFAAETWEESPPVGMSWAVVS
jgi:hypothetical protein